MCIHVYEYTYIYIYIYIYVCLFAISTPVTRRRRSGRQLRASGSYGVALWRAWLWRSAPIVFVLGPRVGSSV